MLNKPRPRKIVSVIKTSSSSEESFKQDEQTYENEFKSQSPTTPVVVTKPQGPVVPQYSSTQTPRKPIVATLKKAHIPPPPSFSDSPKSITTNLQQRPAEPVKIEPSTPKVTAVLSPKSSGESFLDAADKAADFIGGAFIVK